MITILATIQGLLNQFLLYTCSVRILSINRPIFLFTANYVTGINLINCIVIFFNKYLFLLFKMVDALIVYAGGSRCELLVSVSRLLILVLINHICIATAIIIDHAIKFLYRSPMGLCLHISEKKFTLRYRCKYTTTII